MSEGNVSKLVRLEVNNMMSIRFAEVEFDEAGGLVVIGGANGSGKSSLIESLLFAFGGKKAIDKDALRYGAEKGFVNVTLGGQEFQIRIRRTINKKGGETLTVKGADGKPINSPQAVLNTLMGIVGIDPSIIWKMGNAEISKALRDAMGLDLTTMDSEEKTFYDERAVANRSVKSLHSSRANIDVFPDVPEERVSMTGLLDELKVAQDHNAVMQTVADKMKDSSERRADAVEKILRLKAQIEECQVMIVDLDKEVDGAEAFLRESDAVDIDEIKARMASAEDTNKKIDSNGWADSMDIEIEKAELDAKSYDEKIEAVRQQKRDLIVSAEFPLDGVEFDQDGNLILDGKPWQAWSDGERLLAAFEIAAAMSPNLEAVVMRQGAWLDDESRQVVANIAKEKGYLVLMEVVGDSNEVSIFMEDGQLKDRR